MYQFNVLHIILITVMLLSGVVLYLFFNKNELDDKLNTIKLLATVNLFITIIRLFWIMFSKNYSYNFLDDLFLNPVEVISIAAFIIMFKGKYQHIHNLYFLGIFFSIIMIIFPSSKYFGNIFYIHNALYIANLYLNLLICFFVSSVYKPGVNDIITSIKNLFSIVVIVFCINTLLIVSGLNESANYFYTVQGENNLLFSFIHKLIPISFVYFLVVIILVWLWSYLLYGISFLLEKPINRFKRYLNKDISWYVSGKKIIKKEIK